MLPENQVTRTSVLQSWELRIGRRLTSGPPSASLAGWDSGWGKQQGEDVAGDGRCWGEAGLIYEASSDGTTWQGGHARQTLGDKRPEVCEQCKQQGADTPAAPPPRTSRRHRDWGRPRTEGVRTFQDQAHLAPRAGLSLSFFMRNGHLHTSLHPLKANLLLSPIPAFAQVRLSSFWLIIALLSLSLEASLGSSG